MVPSICNDLTEKFMETKSRLISGCLDLGGVGGGDHKGTGFFLEWQNVLKLDCADGCTTLNIMKTISLYTLSE